MLDEANQFHIPKIIQYIVFGIPRIEEWLARYKTSFAIVMEPWETFIGRAMRHPTLLKFFVFQIVQVD
jgi:hypothetical protein